MTGYVRTPVSTWTLHKGDIIHDSGCERNMKAGEIKMALLGTTLIQKSAYIWEAASEGMILPPDHMLNHSNISGGHTTTEVIGVSCISNSTRKTICSTLGLCHFILFIIVENNSHFNN